MSKHVVFKGGWLDIPGLLRGLAGWPLQAEVEEVCTSHPGDSTRRRTGRVLVDRQRRLRLEIQEEGLPTVVFVHDPNRRLVVCGVADRPDTWVRMPWGVPLPAPGQAPTLSAADLQILVEFSNEDGVHRYRLFNAKYEDPDESLFPKL